MHTALPPETAKTLLTARLIWIQSIFSCLLLPTIEMLCMPMPTDISELGREFIMLSLLVTIPAGMTLAVASLALRLLGLASWRLLKRLETIKDDAAWASALLRLCRVRYLVAVTLAELVMVVGLLLGLAMRIPALSLPYAFVSLLCLWLIRPSALSDALATAARLRR